MYSGTYTDCYIVYPGADVNAAKMHATSLHLAARQDSHEMLELLLAAGADIYARDNQGRVAKQLCHCWNQARQLLDFYEGKMNNYNNASRLTTSHCAPSVWCP